MVQTLLLLQSCCIHSHRGLDANLHVNIWKPIIMATMPSFTKIYHHKSYPSISPSLPELTAKDKVILITGAGTGVGEATAHAFAEAGARVIALCGRRLDPLNKVKNEINSRRLGADVVVFTLDITMDTNVKKVFADFCQQYGPIDILINSAGHISDKGTIAESSLENFWTSFEITCKGGFLIAQAFLKHYNTAVEADPVLIYMNSLLSHMPAPHVKLAPASYASSKMAQGKMIEYVAMENEGKLRAYNIHPGSVVSDMSTKSVNMAEDPEAVRKSVQWDHR